MAPLLLSAAVVQAHTAVSTTCVMLCVPFRCAFLSCADLLPQAQLVLAASRFTLLSASGALLSASGSGTQGPLPWQGTGRTGTAHNPVRL
jgi:hypothetical protein